VRLSIPTPTTSAVEVGPLTIHFYALCIIAGVAVAIWLGDRRFVKANPQAVGVVGDVAIIAVPSGVIGGRLYHVITSPRNILERKVISLMHFEFRTVDSESGALSV
jgi:prolipoprotein diacylglyceryltransferase